MSTFTAQNRRFTDRAPLTSRLSTLAWRWVYAIRYDTRRREDATFALCALVFLAGMWLGANK